MRLLAVVCLHIKKNISKIYELKTLEHTQISFKIVV